MFLSKTKAGNLLLHCIGRKCILNFLHDIIVLHLLATKLVIQRTFKVSSSYVIFCKEINKIKNIPQKNMYSIFVTDNQIIKFLEIQYTTKSNENANKTMFKLIFI